MTMNFDEFITNYYYETKTTSGEVYNKQQTEYGVNYEIAMPGFKKEDVKIEFKIEDGCEQLNIQCKKEDASEKEYIVSKIKRSYNYYIKLDSNVFDVEKTTAKMEDGILYLDIPKKEEKLPKKVEIKVG